MLTLLASFALADSITIDTGATIEADLARYEADADCQLSVTEGDLIGVIVILPCSRILAFQRTPRPAPVVLGPVPEAMAQVEPPLEMPLAVASEEPLPLAMPDSTAALKSDDFLTPFPVADPDYAPDYEAEAEEQEVSAEAEVSEPGSKRLTF